MKTKINGAVIQGYYSFFLVTWYNPIGCPKGSYQSAVFTKKWISIGQPLALPAKKAKELKVS